MSLTRMLAKAANARWSIVLACLCFVFAVGCIGGGGGGGNNGGDNNGGTNNGNVDAGGDTTDDTSGGEDSTEDDTGGGDDTGDDTGGGSCTDGTPITDCDPLCGTGCEASQTCQAGNDANGNFVTSCVPSGDNGAGQECGSEAGGCMQGFGCLRFSENEPATCLEYCRAGADEDPQCSDPDASCTPIVENGNIGVCQIPESNCETFPPEDTCGAGQNCYPLQNGGQDCFDYDDTASAGDTCTTPDQCNDLQACLRTSQGATEGQCFDKCDLSLDAANNRCAESETCQEVTGADFGVCATAG